MRATRLIQIAFLSAAGFGSCFGFDWGSFGLQRDVTATALTHAPVAGPTNNHVSTQHCQPHCPTPAPRDDDYWSKGTDTIWSKAKNTAKQMWRFLLRKRNGLQSILPQNVLPQALSGLHSQQQLQVKIALGLWAPLFCFWVYTTFWFYRYLVVKYDVNDGDHHCNRIQDIPSLRASDVADTLQALLRNMFCSCCHRKEEDNPSRIPLLQKESVNLMVSRSDFILAWIVVVWDFVQFSYFTMGQPLAWKKTLHQESHSVFDRPFGLLMLDFPMAWLDKISFEWAFWFLVVVNLSLVFPSKRIATFLFLPILLPAFLVASIVLPIVLGILRSMKVCTNTGGNGRPSETLHDGGEGLDKKQAHEELEEERDEEEEKEEVQLQLNQGADAAWNETTHDVMLTPSKYGLGLVLDGAQTQGEGGAIATAFKQNPKTGEMLPAEDCGLIKIGDRLVEINNQSLERLGLAEMLLAIGNNTKSGSVLMRFVRKVTPPEVLGWSSCDEMDAETPTAQLIHRDQAPDMLLHTRHTYLSAYISQCHEKLVKIIINLKAELNCEPYPADQHWACWVGCCWNSCTKLLFCVSLLPFLAIVWCLMTILQLIEKLFQHLQQRAHKLPAWSRSLCKICFTQTAVQCIKMLNCSTVGDSNKLVLVSHHSCKCWQGYHIVLGCFSITALVLTFSIAMSNIEANYISHPAIKYRPEYEVVVLALKLWLSTFHSIFPSYPELHLSNATAVLFLVIAMHWWIQPALGSSPVVNDVRSGCFGGAFWGLCCAWLTCFKSYRPATYWVVYFCGLFPSIAAGYWLNHQRSNLIANGKRTRRRAQVMMPFALLANACAGVLSFLLLLFPLAIAAYVDVFLIMLVVIAVFMVVMTEWCLLCCILHCKGL
jgi:hypothetical protein